MKSIIIIFISIRLHYIFLCLKSEKMECIFQRNIHVLLKGNTGIYFFVSLHEHGRHLGITFFARYLSVRHTFSSHHNTSHFFVTFSNNFFSTQRIGLKLQTNVYINMYNGFTKREISKYFSVRVIAPFSVKNYVTLLNNFFFLLKRLD